MTTEEAIRLTKERFSHFYYMIPIKNEPLKLDSEVVLYYKKQEPALRTTIGKLIPEGIDKETAQKFEPSIWHASSLIDYDGWHRAHPFAILPPIGEPPAGIPLPMFKCQLIQERLQKKKKGL